MKKASGLDVLAVVPYQLGFQPKQSIVVIALKPPRSRLGMMSRLDLATTRQPGAGHAVARQLLQYLKADGANGAFVIRYASPADGPAEQDRAMRSVVEVFERSLDKVVSWDVVAPKVIPLQPGTLQAMAHSYTTEDLASTQMAATMIAQGATYLPERADLALLPDISQAQVRQASRSQRRVLDKAQMLTGSQLADWRLEELARWRRWLDLLAEAGDAVDQVEVPACELGHLGALLQEMPGRDAVLVLILDEAPGAELAAIRGGFDDRVFDQLATPGHQPSDRYLLAAPRLLALVAAHQVKRRRGGTLALMAWFAWWHSDGARAEVLADAALALPEPPSLAHLIKDLVQCSALPGALRLRAGQNGGSS